MNRKIECLHCHCQMRHIANQKLQLGQTGWLLGDLPNLLAGALKVSIYTCPTCGKIEFFQSSNENTQNSIPQRKCPACGQNHDMDDPKCPFCKFDYYKK